MTYPQRVARAGAISALAFAGATGSCAGSHPLAPRAPIAKDDSADERRRVEDFARVEDDAIGWLAAADPRLAERTGSRAPDAVLRQIGTASILAEDVTAQIRADSLDLFAFRARGSALDEAAKRVAAFSEPLPDAGPADSPIDRPQLERELLMRTIEEERARTRSEAQLGDAAGDLVRGILATWTPPSAPQEWLDRDVWVSKHLLEIRDSLRGEPRRSGPPDIDVALYPLERLLAPLVFPRGAAAIAEIRLALDGDPRAVPPLVEPERVAREVEIHLGVRMSPEALPARMNRIEDMLRVQAERALADPGGRSELLARARELLYVERPCPAVPRSRMRAMSPPPERAAVCGVLRALTEEPRPAAAIIALHDDVLLAEAAVTTSPPPRTKLLSGPDDDVVDSLERQARERPVVAVGVALAAEIVFGGGNAGERIRVWRSLGEAPLDVLAREF
ncbi:MAG: hypothetical protein ABSC94_00995 [Polyangiaceae bacterium]